jgi:L-fucose isomerase-like protein
MTMIMVTSFSGKPGFITDPVFDISENEVHHLHCTSATAMQGVGGPGSPYVLRGYPYSGDINATCIQVLFDGQGPVTVAKFSGPQVLLVSTGEVMGNIDVDRGCRNKMRTRVSDAQKLLRNWSLVNIATDQRPARAWDFRQETMEGLHRVVFYGDHVEMIERLGRLTGFRVFHEL